MVKYFTEEDLFNRSYGNSVLYVFQPSKNVENFVLTEFVSHNPLRVRALEVFKNYVEVSNRGKMLGMQRSISFLDGEIYSPY